MVTVKTKICMTTSDEACSEKAMTKMNLRDFGVQVCVLKKMAPLGATNSEKINKNVSVYFSLSTSTQTTY